jgi:hypothetical protein
VIETKTFPLTELIWATGLNALDLICAFLFFNFMFRTVKRKGLLVRVGE